MLSRRLGSKPVRGLCIATKQYSSLCVSAVDLILGGSDDMEDDEQDREQIDNEWEKVEAREKEEKDKTKTNNARSNMWWHVHEWFCQTRAVTPWATMWCVHKITVFEKSLVWNVSIYTETVPITYRSWASTRPISPCKRQHREIRLGVCFRPLTQCTRDMSEVPISSGECHGKRSWPSASFTEKAKWVKRTHGVHPIISEVLVQQTVEWSMQTSTSVSLANNDANRNILAKKLPNVNIMESACACERECVIKSTVTVTPDRQQTSKTHVNANSFWLEKSFKQCQTCN